MTIDEATELVCNKFGIYMYGEDYDMLLEMVDSLYQNYGADDEDYKAWLLLIAYVKTYPLNFKS